MMDDGPWISTQGSVPPRPIVYRPWSIVFVPDPDPCSLYLFDRRWYNLRMTKITIIGLGLVGNSIGLGLQKAFAGSTGEGTSGPSGQIVGFDPHRSREEAALRKQLSVSAIAPNLEQAVRGAQLVIICTPFSGAREVLEAIGPFLDEGATVTDTLSLKEPALP